MRGLYLRKRPARAPEMLLANAATSRVIMEGPSCPDDVACRSGSPAQSVDPTKCAGLQLVIAGGHERQAYRRA
jgi:hypothetical protein